MYGKKKFKQVTFHCNYAEKKRQSEMEMDNFLDDEGVEVLTKEQKSYNSAVRNTRARVENIFGILKTMYQSLSIPWREDTRQLDYLVTFGCGVLNENKN